MNDRARGVGLGYDKNISEAEVQANEQIHRLKKQLQREQKQRDDEAEQEKKEQKLQRGAAERLGSDGKGAMIGKKSGHGDERSAQMERKRDQKTAKKDRQKAKKEQSSIKESSESQVADTKSSD